MGYVGDLEEFYEFCVVYGILGDSGWNIDCVIFYKYNCVCVEECCVFNDCCEVLWVGNLIEY